MRVQDTSVLRGVGALALILVFAACGGGGGGGGNGSGEGPDNAAPTANAGADQVVAIGDEVTLDGTASTDPDGDMLTYTWSLATPNGSDASLMDTSAVQPRFTADIPGEYVATLIVNDGTDDSEPDLVTILADGDNLPPVANAGADQSVDVGATITLDGSASMDPDGDQLSYMWMFTEVPDGSETALDNPDAVAPSFTADLDGTYTVELVVNDGLVDSDPDEVTVATTGTDNLPPVADAGADVDAMVGETVMLDGSGSSDPEGEGLTYAWSFVNLPGGSTAALDDPTSATPSFTIDVNGLYIVQLIVSDGELESDPDPVSIATPNTPPVARSGFDTFGFVGEPVILDGRQSFDADGDTLTYAWSLEGPGATVGSIGDPTLPRTTFTPTEAGTFTAMLVVDDGRDSSEPHTFEVAVSPAPEPPVLMPVADATVTVGDVLAFDLVATDADSATLTYGAGPVPMPGGARLDTATGAFWFRPSRAEIGTHELTFSATDGTLTATQTATVTVEDTAAGSGTGIRGRMLHANDAAMGVETPLVGATIRNLETGIETITDANGEFVLTGLDPGDNHVEYDATTVTSPAGSFGAYRAPYVFEEDVILTIDRPIYIMELDADGTAMVEAGVETTVTNAELGITMTVPADAVRDDADDVYTGPISISEVPRGFTPGSLPPELDPEMVITIQPSGLTFDQPAPITWPNTDNLEPGTIVNIWSMDHDSGQFFVAGRGEVTPDGTQIVTISGGVREASWHFIMSLAPLIRALTSASGDCQCSIDLPGTNSSPSSQGGSSTGYTPPPVNSGGDPSGPRFAYGSGPADPRPLLRSGTSFPGGNVPDELDHGVRVGGNNAPGPWTDTSGLRGSGDDALLGQQLDARNLPTGVHDVEVSQIGHWNNSAGGSTTTAQIIVDNRTETEFGSGWGVTGLRRLYPQPDGSVLQVDGDGSYQWFRAGPLPPDAFEPLETLSVADETADLDSGDFNEDGDLDLVVADSVTRAVQIYLGDGDGTFSTGQSIDIGDGVIFRTIPADITGNDHLDIVGVAGGNFTSWRVFLLEGAGDGTFTRVENIADFWPIDIDVADIDRNGFPDVAFVDQSSPRHAGILFNNGDGTWTEERRPRANFGRHLTVADMNGDRMADSISVEIGLDGDVQVVSWDGASFTELTRVETSGPLPTGIASGDIDGDGNVDVVVVAESSDTNGRPQAMMYGMIGAGDGNLDTRFRTPLPGDPNGVTLADVTNDGILDAVVSMADLDSVNVHVGDGRGRFLRATPFPVSTGDPYRTEVQDFDGDGWADIVSISRLTGQINVLQGTGNINDGLRVDGEPAQVLREEDGGGWVLTRGDGAIEVYDADGCLVSITDPLGRETVYTYDDEKRLSQITDPFDQVWTFVYAGGSLDSMTDPAGRTSFFEHDSRGNLVAIVAPDGSVRRYAYDLNHRLVAESMPDGSVRRFTYDENGLLAGETTFAGDERSLEPADARLLPGDEAAGTALDPLPVTTPDTFWTTVTDGSERSMRYLSTPGGQVREIQNGEGRTELRAGRDDTGNLTRIEFADRSAMTIEYDSFGRAVGGEYDPISGTTQTWSRTYDGDSLRPETTASGDGRTRTNTYDDQGRLETVDAGDGRLIEMTWTDDAFLESITDPDGETVSYTYDDRGNVETITRPGATTARLTYDDAGQLVAVTEYEGTDREQTTTVTWDDGGRMTSVTNPGGNVTRMSYDANGFPSMIVLPDGTRQHAEYGADGRVLSESLPTGEAMVYTYDGEGRLASVTIGDRITSYGYDDEGRLVETVQPDGSTLGISYEFSRDLAERFIDGEGGALQYDYDAFGRVTQLRDGGGVTWDYTYNDLGRVASARYIGSETIDYVYDDVGRLAERQMPEETAIFTYSPAGQILTANDDDSALTYTYNDDGQLTRMVIEDVGVQPEVTVDFAYDADTGYLIEMTDSFGGRTTFEYDDQGRTIAVTGLGDQRVQVDYDDVGRLVGYGFPNGTASTYAFDDGLLSGVTHEHMETGLFWEADYTWEGPGLLSTATDNGDETSYTYDMVGRLLTAGDLAWTWDDAGNRLSSPNQESASYDRGNRLRNDDASNYTWDNAGRLISRRVTDGGATTTYTWDTLGHLTQVDMPDATVITYRYDALDRRIEQSVDGEITRYIWDDTELLFELDAEGNVIARYLPGVLVDQPLGVQRDGETYHFHYDQIGSVRAMTDSSGAVVNTYTWDPFGMEITVDEAVDNSLGYVGREHDASGLIYMRFRYYDPSLGMFVSPDPLGINGGDLNLYAYADANPLIFADPFGLNSTPGPGPSFGGDLGLSSLGTSSSLLSAMGQAQQNGPGTTTALAALASLTGNLADLGDARWMARASRIYEGISQLADLGPNDLRALGVTADQVLESQGEIRRLAAGYLDDAGRWSRVGTAAGIFGAGVAAYDEYTNSNNTTTAGALTQSAGVAAVGYIPNPHWQAIQAVSGCVDVGFETVGLQRPGAHEILGNTARVGVTTVEALATGDTRGLNGLRRRMTSGQLGSATQGLSRAGEWLGENILYHAF